MKKCLSCKEELPEKAKYCPACGEKVGSKKEASKATLKEVDDIEENKGITVFSYLGPLALIPYFLAKDSKFARYHALQGLNLFLVEIIYVILFFIVSIVGTIGIFARYGIIGDFNYFSEAPVYIIVMVALVFIGFVLQLFSVVGIIDVISGKAQELPIVGKIKIIK